ncbi:TPA: glucose-1-phosphate cytidylyltransferase [Campylobacter jejuni]|nr:glucose-1-phosphate cytidylyltransferase [Campylobacter jejuni]MCW1346944.1 glucose-1-phosphate cytidylyltransferase [Campylobacter jejuni]MCW1348049.1 glucose-1-phosphate cytidylyltransferase [Campylobacter jejuni]HEC1692816.1 glucose-1-phosphate cytidylyltransferase [Campylobacter jejuni]
MKVLILAGGFGTRLSEETNLIPKPMVEIGGKPILWHIMKIYSYYGFNDFIILTGYKGHVIKDYFINYYTQYSDITVDMSNNSVTIHNTRHEPWKVTMLYTGQDSMTGGRILHARNYINNETFMLTYGDGVSDIDILDLLNFHKKHNGVVTMTSIIPDGKFGVLDIDNTTNRIKNFIEKPKGDVNLSNVGWINGGFFVCEPEVFNYIENGAYTIFEQEPLRKLALNGELYSYKHYGFWKCMDTLKDKLELNKMLNNNEALWKKWE